MDELITEDAVEKFQIPERWDLYKCIQDITINPKQAEHRLQTIRNIVEDIIRQEKDSILLRELPDQRRGETVLHTAIRLFNFGNDVEKEVVEILVKNFPKLILQDRGDSEYAGQTPLHMAVCKGNIWLVNKLLQEMSKKENKHWRNVLFTRRASGVIFNNTVMMAELPLSIAALTFNKGMFDLLLDQSAALDATNRHGDNVCHSLIRYAFLYQDKLEDVLEMCRYISEDPSPFDTGSKATRNRKLRKKIWMMENNDSLNPLQLSAKLGQDQLFCFIMNLEAYCFENCKDGLFDIKIYDVTDIDAISSMTSEEIKGENSSVRHEMMPENASSRILHKKESSVCRKSVLMMLLELEPETAFRFILFPPLRRIIDQKWNAYRIYFYPLSIVYFLMMCFLTWYAVERSQQNENTAFGFDTKGSPNFKHKIPDVNFVTVYGVLISIIAAVIIIQDIIRVAKGRMQWTLNSFLNPYSNGSFRIMFIMFGLSLIIDIFLAIWSKYYENYCLIIALILGWFNIIFFLRAVRPFSFFTVLIQRVLVGDMFRFFVILGLELLAFSTALYMAIQGSDTANNEDFSDFGRVLYSMLKLMVGLGEIAALYDTRHSEVAILIFISFIILTTLLMINALIAMMSGTCAELVQNTDNISARDRHWKLQRLSVILFIESIMPNIAMIKIGKEQTGVYRYNNQIGRRKKMKRYMLEIRSIQDEFSTNEEEPVTSSSWGLKTALVNALKNKHISHNDRPQSGISDKMKQWFRRKTRRDEGEESYEKEVVNDDEWNRQETPIHHISNNNPEWQQQLELPSSPAHQLQQQQLDIYHVTNCQNCSNYDVSQDV